MSVMLSDGCPFIEFGAATDSAGNRWCMLRTLSADGGVVIDCLSIVGERQNFQPHSLALDLGHRPTRLELAARCIERLPLSACAQMSKEGTVSTWVNGTPTHCTDLKALWRQLDGAK